MRIITNCGFVKPRVLQEALIFGIFLYGEQSNTCVDTYGLWGATAGLVLK